ncbi:amino acid ABC transporter substrate-binding protein [Candidatus Dependentiae bacterium]|nr:MAG: amino acid ABC transporter substrate-binding protein [Candidatus Dependentiae bacterium]
MKKQLHIYSLLFILISFFSGCFQTEHNRETEIKFGVSAEYPPFEFYRHGEIVGFDIDLARLIAQNLGKKALFEDIPFETILAALSNKDIDAGISTITITQDRKKMYDCSIPYYKEILALVYKKTEPFKTVNELSHKQVGAQLGTAQQIWLAKNNPEAEIISMNNNNQLIEALKAEQINAVIIDLSQADAFCKKNSNLEYFRIKNSSEPYGVVFEKNSPLTEQVNKIIETLKKEGKIDELIKKWLTTSEG